MILRWDGEAWRQMASTPRVRLTGVVALAADDAWAVGTANSSIALYSERTAALLHWDGRRWERLSIGNLPPLRAIAMADGEGWILGWDGIALRYGSAGGRQPGPVPTATARIVPTPTPCPDNGSPNPCRRAVHAVTARGPDDAWAVGRGGVILHWDGRAWNSVESPVHDDLFDVAVAGPRTGWAVGDRGTILRWDGQAWRP